MTYPRQVYTIAAHDRALAAHQVAWEAMRSARLASGTSSDEYAAARRRCIEARTEVRRVARLRRGRR